MGRASLIMVLGFIVIFGSLRNNLDKTTQESSLNSSVFTESILAHHVTNIAANYIMSIHSETGISTKDFSDSSFLDGSYTASIESVAYDSILDYDTLLIRVTGIYEAESDTIRVQFVSKSLLVPKITASVAIESDCTIFDFAGNPQIRGIDTNMDGTTGPGPDLAGITLSNVEDSTRFEAVAASNPTWVQGDPVVEVSLDPPLIDLSDLVQYYAGLADLSYEGGNFNGVSWGSEESPVIVYSNGNTSFGGSSIGYGVLAINGSLSMSGNPTWYGLIIASGGESLVIDASVGNPTIYGALHIGATVTELEMKGTADIFYSSEAINMVRTALINGGKDKRIITEKIWYE